MHTFGDTPCPWRLCLLAPTKMTSTRYDHTGRRWRCGDEALLDEYREEVTGEMKYHLRLGKPWGIYRTLRGARQAARDHGAFGEWVEEATTRGGWLEIGWVRKPAQHPQDPDRSRSVRSRRRRGNG